MKGKITLYIPNKNNGFLEYGHYGVFYDLEAGLPEGDFYWVLVDVFH